MAKRPARKKIGKKKKWFKIHAPNVFKKNVFSETLAHEPEDIRERTIEAPLSNISGDITKQNRKLKLKIEKIEGGEAFTKIIAYNLSKPYLQRMVRRRTNKVSSVDDLKLKDGKKYRIQTIGITLKKCNSSQKTALRKRISKQVKEMFKGFDIGSLVIALSTNKLQGEMKSKVSKAYPLRFLDVKKVELLKEKRKTRKEKADEEKKEKSEEKESEEKSKETESDEKKEEKNKEKKKEEEKKSEDKKEEKKESKSEKENEKEEDKEKESKEKKSK